MNRSIEAERVLDAFLAPDHDRLPDRVVEAALVAITRTPQRRALRVPWRFSLMSNTRRASAGIAIVLIVGVGVAAFALRSSSAGVGAALTPAPSATPTRAPTPTPAPSEVAPGITGFTPYTSQVYGLTFGVPNGWSQGLKATEKWRRGVPEDVPVAEGFEDGNVAFVVWQQPAGPGADITTRDGLTAWVTKNDPGRDIEGALPLCVGKAACGPAILLPRAGDEIPAYIADPDSGVVTIVMLGRPDDHPSTTRYGGGIQLLESILTTMDVWTPEPGQIPSGG